MELKDYIVSIDLGCSKVVAALGTLDDTGNVVVADFVCKPMSGFTRGEISNIESVSKALKSAVSELESRNNIIVSDVLVSVEGRHVVCADNSGFVYIGSDGEILDENVRQLHENMNNVQAPEGMTILSPRIEKFRKRHNFLLYFMILFILLSSFFPLYHKFQQKQNSLC